MRSAHNKPFTKKRVQVPVKPGADFFDYFFANRLSKLPQEFQLLAAMHPNRLQLNRHQCSQTVGNCQDIMSAKNLQHKNNHVLPQHRLASLILPDRTTAAGLIGG